MKSKSTLFWLLVAALIAQVHCGGGNTDSTRVDQILKKRTTHNGNDKLLLLEEYFYEGDSSKPARIEFSEPNASGHLVVVKMQENAQKQNRREFLEVEFDPKTLKETNRRTITETLGTRGGDSVVIEAETVTEANGSRATEVVSYSYRVIEGMARISRQKTRRGGVTVEIEEWDYDTQGRPVSNRLEDGDGDLKRRASFDWENGTLSETVYNDAGKVAEQVTGRMVYQFERVIRISETRVGNVLEISAECKIKDRTLTCSEITADRFSGEKVGQDDLQIALDGKGAVERPLEEKHARFDDDSRILLVADDWNYRSDRQVKLQIHEVESASQAVLLHFSQEFDELYDFRLIKDYNDKSLPVFEHKDTEDPLMERLVRYEYGAR